MPYYVVDFEKIQNRQNSKIIKTTKRKNMRTYKIYASSTATGDAIANVIVQKSCRIKSIRWEATFDQVADNSAAAIELSTRNVSQLTNNDSVGDISCLRAHNNLVTSGMHIGRANKQEMLDYPVAAGERLYLNCTITTTTLVVTVFIDVVD